MGGGGGISRGKSPGEDTGKIFIFQFFFPKPARWTVLKKKRIFSGTPRRGGRGAEPQPGPRPGTRGKLTKGPKKKKKSFLFPPQRGGGGGGNRGTDRPGKLFPPPFAFKRGAGPKRVSSGPQGSATPAGGGKGRWGGGPDIFFEASSPGRGGGNPWGSVHSRLFPGGGGPPGSWVLKRGGQSSNKKTKQKRGPGLFGSFFTADKTGGEFFPPPGV